MNKMIRVHPDFKKMLVNTLEEINRHTETKMTMEELTEILAVGTNGSNTGVLALKMPIIIIPSKKTRGRPVKSLWDKYVNIVLEDRPR